MVDRELMDEGERPDGIHAGVFLATVIGCLLFTGAFWWGVWRLFVWWL